MKKLLYLFIALFIAGTAYAQSVEFGVNMRVAIIKGNFNPASDIVHIAGTLNNWTTTANELTDPNHDSIYTATIDTFAVGDTVKFKFVINSGGWEGISDRVYIVPSGSSSITAYYNNDSIVSAASASVEFKVNMSVKVKKTQFVIGTDEVKLAGTFNNWTNGATVLTDTDGDSIYTVTIDTFHVGDALSFKFIMGASGWEDDPNRSYTVPEGGGVVSVWFNNDSIYTAATKSLDVTFSCNMEFEIVSGRFIPGTDTLTVRGSFNGWSGTDIMAPSAGDPNYYEKTVSYVTTVGEVINYKYAYMNKTGTAWEGDPNKTYTVTQDDYDMASAFAERTYNNLTLDNITNNVVTIKFVVNMDGAISSLNNEPFASIDNVYIAGANPPLQWPGGGWPNSDSATIHYLYNDGTHGDLVAADSLWSLDLAFPQYSPLRIQYKYGANWGLPSNGGANDNENGVGADHFLNLTADLISATVRNQFGKMGDHELVDIITDIRELPNTVPTVYSLNQNYPNPFNPVTNIRFSVPQAGLVTLKVYNLIGQEVATLLNDVKTAGTYDVNFNAANLSSGVYFYRINAGTYTSTMKMILMK